MKTIIYKIIIADEDGRTIESIEATQGLTPYSLLETSRFITHHIDTDDTEDLGVCELGL